MSALPPHDVPAIFWIDGAGQQQGPEPLATVIERIAHNQIPATTPVWWQGAANWSPFDSTPDLVTALRERLAPPPQSNPDSFAPDSFAPAASPFAPVATFDDPAAFAPAATFDDPAAFAPAATFDDPAAFAPAATFDAPATIAFNPPVSADAATVNDSSSSHGVAETMATYESTVAVDEPTPVTSEVPEVIIPNNEVSVVPSLQLGDAGDLASTFTELVRRSSAFDAETARAAALDATLANLVRQGLLDLGFVIEDTQTSDDYHSFRLGEPDGATASLAIQRVPAASTVVAATERPVTCFVDRADRASVGLFVADYLTDDSSGDGVDQSLFTRHLASVVAAAGQPS